MCGDRVLKDIRNEALKRVHFISGIPGQTGIYPTAIQLASRNYALPTKYPLIISTNPDHWLVLEAYLKSIGIQLYPADEPRYPCLTDTYYELHGISSVEVFHRTGKGDEDDTEKLVFHSKDSLDNFTNPNKSHFNNFKEESRYGGEAVIIKTPPK